MAKQDDFRKALSNFTYDMASGDAIRYMAGQGYSVRQIMERLDFPTPAEKVQQTVWQYLLDTEVLLLDVPGMAQPEQVKYMRTYDQYGKASFIQVAVPGSGREAVCFEEKDYCEARDGRLVDFLGRLSGKNGEDASYISCDFGLYRRRDADGYRKRMLALNSRQREYVEGLPWERCIAYHRLDRRMREITGRLYEAGVYQGEAFFLKSKEKIDIRLI